MMKRFLAFATCFAVICGFAACSSGGDDENGGNPGGGNSGGEPSGPVAPSAPGDYANRVVSEDGLTLVATSQFVEVGDTNAVNFAVFMDGVNVTNAASIYVINNGQSSKLTEPSFKFTSSGDHKFWASYKTYNTKETLLTISALNVRPALATDAEPANTDFLRRIMLIQGTGVACTYCPNAIGAIKDFYATSEDADRVVLAAVHTFTAGDPLYSEGARKLGAQAGISSYPTLKFNFDGNWSIGGAPQSEFSAFINEAADELLKYQSETGIAVSTDYDATTGVISVTAGVKCDAPGKYKVTAVLVQDNVYYPQTGTKLQEYFVHEAGVIAISPASGGGFLLNCGDTTKQGTTYEYSCEFNAADLVAESYTYTLDVLRDARVLVYVQANGKIVDNIVSCGMNEKVGFAYNAD